MSFSNPYSNRQDLATTASSKAYLKQRYEACQAQLKATAGSGAASAGGGGREEAGYLRITQ
jgi:hypothetical protein